MIGFDFPIKPCWIHDVHALWRPGQPVSELVAAALAQTMQELGGAKARRNSLTIILRYFVTTKGGGQSRRTVGQDIWVAYSRVYPVSTMTPAYLVYLIAQNKVTQEACRYLAHRYHRSDIVTSGALRRHLIGRFGERRVVLNAASAFLRTLCYFDVLTEGERRGEYRFIARLPVSRAVFPLVVWAWWQRHRSPQIDLDPFAEEATDAFLAPETFTAHWQAFQPVLWVLEERLGNRRATLKYGDESTFRQALWEMIAPQNHML